MKKKWHVPDLRLGASWPCLRDEVRLGDYESEILTFSFLIHYRIINVSPKCMCKSDSVLVLPRVSSLLCHTKVDNTTYWIYLPMAYDNNAVGACMHTSIVQVTLCILTPRRRRT
jgi:hypothetical protein